MLAQLFSLDLENVVPVAEQDLESSGNIYDAWPDSVVLSNFHLKAVFEATVFVVLIRVLDHLLKVLQSLLFKDIFDAKKLQLNAIDFPEPFIDDTVESLGLIDNFGVP